MFTLGLMNIHQLISIPRTIWTWVCSPNVHSGDGRQRRRQHIGGIPLITKLHMHFATALQGSGKAWRGKVDAV